MAKGELFSQTATFTWVATATIKNTEKALNCGLWDIVTKARGLTIKNAGMALCTIRMGAGTKASGKRDRSMEKAGLLIRTEWLLKENGT